MSKCNLKPVIKWSGSKRSQAEDIVALFPSEIGVYTEPFVGGGSLFGHCMLKNKASRYIISDFNKTLIELWTMIRDNPEYLLNHYKILWNELNTSKDPAKVYYEIRKRFNTNPLPEDFMFILRTCVNGMPRYNSSGQFNTSFHHNRSGIKPLTLEKIVYEWSNLINKNNVTFLHRSYEEVLTQEEDVLYLDPPYANTKGMYYGALNNEKFFEWLRTQKGRYYLSFDGKSGGTDSTYKVPEDLYSKHIYIKSGNSSFKRTMTGDRNAVVEESLYIK